jgi:hypothetical protein
MKRLGIITALLVFGLVSPVLAQSIGIGVKFNSELATGVFSEWYLSPSFSLGLSLGVQSAAVTVEAAGRFYSPGYMSALAFYGGGGGRLEVAGGSLQPFALLLLGIKLRSGFNLSLLGELKLVSALYDLRRFDSEVWLGLEVRFRF